MLRYTLLFLFTIFFAVANSQEFSQINTIVERKITYSELSENEPGVELFKLLAIENNISINKLSLIAKSRLAINIYRDGSNNLRAGISLSPVSISGSTNIKEFEVDSILWPSIFQLKLQVFNGNHLRDEIELSCTTDSRVNLLNLSDYNQNIGEFSLKPGGYSYQFSEKDYLKVERLSELISYYYSAGMLLDKVIQDYNHKTLNANPSFASIFNNKIELDRVIGFLHSYGYFGKLNLAINDPVGLLSHIKKLNRLVKRSETLFVDILNEYEGVKFNYMDFCSIYAGLSKDYLEEAAKLQPSEALGFRTVAEIPVNNVEIETLNEIVSYAVQLNIDKKQLPECIVGEFVDLCKASNNDHNYTDALLLLTNARIIADLFKTEPDSDYFTSISSTISGISESYFRVGYKALMLGNQEFASQYIGRANSTLDDYKYLLKDIRSEDTLFNSIIDIQIKIALAFTENMSFEYAFNTINRAGDICASQPSIDYCSKVDTITCYIRNSFLTAEIDKFEKSISNYQYPDAFMEFNSIQDYIVSTDCIDENLESNFNEKCYSLFLVFMQQGEILTDAHQPTTAMENLLSAKAILTYLEFEQTQVDSLIKVVAQPVILSIIDDGRFLNWAKKTFDAEIKLNKARELSTRYFKNANMVVNKAINDLSKQMDLRDCLDHRNTYNDALKTAKIMLSHAEYDNFPDQIKKAQNVVYSYPECEIDNSELIKLKADNYQILSYYRQYAEIRESLLSEDYASVIQKYHNLEEYHNKENLDDYNIVFHSLEDFLLRQNNPLLTKEAVEYFIASELPDESLKYLKILIDQKGESREIKVLSSATARKLAIRDNQKDISLNDALQTYTQGKQRLNYFKAVYIKNRVIKPSD